MAERISLPPIGPAAAAPSTAQAGALQNDGALQHPIKTTMRSRAHQAAGRRLPLADESTIPPNPVRTVRRTSYARQVALSSSRMILVHSAVHPLSSQGMLKPKTQRTSIMKRRSRSRPATASSNMAAAPPTRPRSTATASSRASCCNIETAGGCRQNRSGNRTWRNYRQGKRPAASRPLPWRPSGQSRRGLRSSMGR